MLSEHLTDIMTIKGQKPKKQNVKTDGYVVNHKSNDKVVNFLVGKKLIERFI